MEQPKQEFNSIRDFWDNLVGRALSTCPPENLETLRLIFYAGAGSLADLVIRKIATGDSPISVIFDVYRILHEEDLGDAKHKRANEARARSEEV